MTDHSEQEQSTRLAQRLAQRLERNPEFLASIFSAIRTAENVDDRGLANSLGAPLDQLPLIALCRTPRADLFREDIDEIATEFSLDPTRLAETVRQGQALSAFSQAYLGELLAAARDHAAEERADYAPDEEQTEQTDNADEEPSPRPESDPRKPGGER